jgi:hypothetical protein
MNDLPENQILRVSNFQDLVSKPFIGETNALCWHRNLEGDFSEIVHQFAPVDNMTILDEVQLRELSLSEQGNLARETVLSDMAALKAQGASPTLNLIKNYDRDDAFPFFPTDVYSFHVDRSPIPTNTFLCTYYGEPSKILPNNQAEQKILVPAIRNELKKLYHGPEAGFDAFLTEYFFDLHYQSKPSAIPINLGIGHLWRLAVDHPSSAVLPCIHRAPLERNGQTRLLLIC